MPMTLRSLMIGCAGVTILTTGACERVYEGAFTSNTNSEDPKAHLNALDRDPRVSSSTTLVGYKGLQYPVVQTDDGPKVRYFVADDGGGIAAETLIDCNGTSARDCEAALDDASAERSAVDTAAEQRTRTRVASVQPAPAKAEAAQTTLNDPDLPEVAEDTDEAYDYAIDDKKPVTLQVVKGDTWQVKHDGKMLDCEMNSAIGCSLAIKQYDFEKNAESATVSVNTKDGTRTSSDSGGGDGGGR
ncbi:hypothetical protein VK792_01550 [Mesobacterium sp. TK19101]|uniref:Lipoprotein n=1 Tax=Mesobacterium hydrothermale TaxID=3111907 RepID=A0ABU6HBW2_9RHOB|nr:hypothetical protein [Mesobacterium sp. TK19101]MEC3859957.1 hypothetical protein [Mesobacterium sp. TK19101]